MTAKEIAALGYEDGYEAGRDSNTTDPPVDGWDGALVNAIGFQAARRLFGRPISRWSGPYTRGARKGCYAAVAAAQESDR